MSERRFKLDLHTHSLSSDGLLTQDDLFALAESCGVDGLALTDHDTMDGLPAASMAAKQHAMLFLPGVEISTAYRGASIHILGYGVRENDAELMAFLEKYRTEKFGRAGRILQKLSDLGMPMTEEDLPSDSFGNLGRAHIARAMIKKGYVCSVQEAFDLYLFSGKPAYVPKVKAATDEAIMALARSGAVPVLAHPEEILLERNELLSALSEWVACGLKGIEAYHPSHHDAQCEFWDDFARAHGLLVTGGSDFHEEPPKSAQHGRLGSSLRRWPGYANDISALLNLAGM